MSHRFFLLTLLSLIAAPSSPAQQPDCTTVDVPIGVMKPSGEAIEGLTANDFAAQIKKRAVSIQSIASDSGPRRILLVIDASHRLSSEARKAQVEFVSDVVLNAQPGDSMALIVARGPVHEVKFGADRAALLQAIKDSAQETKDPEKLGVLDAVAAGINWFGEPQLGDSIVVVAIDLEGNHSTNYKSVVKMLEEHHVRLFGMALGHLLLTNQVIGTQQTDREGFGYREPGIPIYNADADADFFPLSVNSGGYIVQEDTKRTNQDFKVNEAKKKELEKTATMMLALIDRFYTVRVAAAGLSHAEPWTLGIAPNKLQSLPGAHVLYPHELSACSSSSAGR